MHSSKSKWVYGEPAGVLILFWVIVFVGLFLDEGALYLFIYLFIYFIYLCIYLNSNSYERSSLHI
jgi:hypothetical protein